MKKISFSLDERSISNAIAQVNALEQEWDKKMDTLLERLATLGATSATLGFRRAIYTGDKDVNVSVEKRGNGYVIHAEGEDVLFIEFGAGIRYGSGHPQSTEFGMGAGTYPSTKGRKAADGKFYLNWEHPDGWWLPKEAGGEHTYGNPPAMVMYRAAREIEQEIEHIAKEVFNGA